LDAYDLYLRSLQHELTREGYESAIRFLRQAIEIDPTFVSAKGSLALAYVSQYSQGWLDPKDREYALSVARDALARGNDDPIALTGAGMAIAGLAREYEQGLQVIEEALVLNPNSSHANTLAGWVCCHLCEGDKARSYIERAMRLSPLDPQMGYMLSGLGWAFNLKREHARALEVLGQALRRIPNWTTACRMKIWALVGLGRIDEAKAAAARHMELDPAFTVSNGSAAVLRDPVLREEYFSALQKAGLPE